MSSAVAATTNSVPAATSTVVSRREARAAGASQVSSSSRSASDCPLSSGALISVAVGVDVQVVELEGALLAARDEREPDELPLVGLPGLRVQRGRQRPDVLLAVDLSGLLRL